jgi:hypothetical protein
MARPLFHQGNSPGTHGTGGCLHTKFHMRNSSGLSVAAMKIKNKIHTNAMFLFDITPNFT